MAELSLEAIVIVIAWFVSLFVAILVVPRLAGKKARSAWTSWLMSKEADPYMDRLAACVISKIPPYPVVPKVPTTEDFLEAIEPRLSGLEERINEPIQLDLDPLILKVTENVRMEVDKIRAVIDGKLGFLNKVEKQTGEAVAEALGNEAAAQAGIDPRLVIFKRRADSLLKDETWVKEHTLAAMGLELLQEEARANVKLSSGGSGTYSPGLSRRRK